MKPLSERPRFLICRLSAIGDTVHTLPLANLIKQRWPEAFVAWAVEKGPAQLLKGQRSIDEVVVVPKGFLKSPQELWRLSARLRALKIDVALDPQSLTKSATLGLLAGAPRRIGFTAPIGRELGPWINNELLAPREPHVVRRYLEILRPLGVHASERDVQFDLPSDAAAEASIDTFLTSVGLTNRFAVVNPGAGWDSKVWPAERYGQVASGLPIPSVVVWAGDKEKAWAETIVRHSGDKAILAPATSLLELTALVRRAMLFVGSDTGPLHIAAAVETPCVAIFGPTRPEVCRPYGSGHTVLRAAYDNLGSARKAAGKTSDAMLQVTSIQVIKACKDSLSPRSGDSKAA
jgi:ADP-heptose:LPS heptosyltransferase